MSTINDMGIAGVSNGILQPKLTNRWRVTFAGMAGGTNTVPLSMQAISVSRPQLEFEEVKLNRYNSIAWVASKHSFQPMKLKLEDDVTNQASTVIQQQLQTQQWITGAQGQWFAAAGDASTYKFACNLSMLDGNDSVIENWTVEGCWIKEVEYGEIEYAEGKAVTISLTIRFDNAYQDFLSSSWIQNNGSALGGA
jgi:hypothetical protein